MAKIRNLKMLLLNILWAIHYYQSGWFLSSRNLSRKYNTRYLPYSTAWWKMEYSNLYAHFIL